MKQMIKLMKEEIDSVLNSNDRLIPALYQYLKIFFDQKGEKPTYYTYLRCIVIGEENKGWQLKSFRVVFAKEGGSQKLLNDGTLLIDTNIVKIPKVWEIKIDSEGRKKYPYIYITEYIEFYPDKY